MRALIAPVFALLLSTLFLQIGSGTASYLIPLRAAEEGWRTLNISLIAAGFAFAFTLGCIVVPRLVFKVGHVRVFSALTALMAVSLLLHSLIVHPVFWILFRAMTGFAVAGSYMVLESWLNEKATNETRGSLFSIYMIVTMAGLTAGQFIVPQADISGTTLFIICGLTFLLSLLPTTLSTASSPQPLNEVQFNIKGMFVRSPIAVVVSVICGFVTGTWMSLAPVYSQSQGLTTTEGAVMLAMAVIGGAIFTYPMGKMSDKVDRRYVMIMIAIMGVISCIAAFFIGVENRILFFGAIVFLGAAIFPLYSVMIAHANDYSAPDEFVETSSSLLIVYGLGSIAGPLVTALAMETFGDRGLFTVIAFSFVVVVAYSFYRISQREQAPEEDRSDFLVTPMARAATPQIFELDPRSDPEWGNDDPDYKSGF
tara:strand:- start:841 stop:2115 length:1275 start_codon:yes stop_codon:yes gene_type:complete